MCWRLMEYFSAGSLCFFFGCTFGRRLCDLADVCFLTTFSCDPLWIHKRRWTSTFSMVTLASHWQHSFFVVVVETHIHCLTARRLFTWCNLHQVACTCKLQIILPNTHLCNSLSSDWANCMLMAAPQIRNMIHQTGSLEDLVG